MTDEYRGDGWEPYPTEWDRYETGDAIADLVRPTDNDIRAEAALDARYE